MVTRFLNAYLNWIVIINWNRRFNTRYKHLFPLCLRDTGKAKKYSYLKFGVGAPIDI